MSYTDDVIDLIERALEGADEGEPNQMKNAPSQDADKQLSAVEDDLTGPDVDLDEEPDDEDDYPDEYDEKGIASEMVDRTLLDQDNAYQAYFRTVMKKHDIKGIRGLSSEKRSTFFKDVSSGWKNHKDNHKKVKESKKIVVSEDYKTHFKSMMKKHGVKRITDLEGAEKKAFFNKVDASWKSVKEQMMQKPGEGYEKGILQSKRPPMTSGEKAMRARKMGKTLSGLIAGKDKPHRFYSVRGKQLLGRKPGQVKEQEAYDDYKKYFEYLMDQCEIDDFSLLTEDDQAEFYVLVNEAFQLGDALEEISEQMQRPGAPITNPMDPRANVKPRAKPERLSRAGAAKAMSQGPVTMYAAGQKQNPMR